MVEVSPVYYIKRFSSTWQLVVPNLGLCSKGTSARSIFYEVFCLTFCLLSERSNSEVNENLFRVLYKCECEKNRCAILAIILYSSIKSPLIPPEKQKNSHEM